MLKNEEILEQFKKSLTATTKSISQNNLVEINFTKENSSINSDFKDSLIDVSLTFKLNSTGGFSDIESDALGNLWIATNTKGAFYIEASKDSLRGNDIISLNAQNGL